MNSLKINDTASLSKVILESDITNFAKCSGDYNPIHINEDVASNSIFGNKIAHGMLVAGLISATIGMKLPGPGTIYLNQELSFKKPVFVGDTLISICKIIDINIEKNKVTIETIIKNQKDEHVIVGQAIVIPPK